MNDLGAITGELRFRPWVPRRRPALRVLAAVSAAVLIAALAGCAPEPVVQAPTAVMLPRLELAAIVAPPAPIDAATVPGLFPQRIVPSGVPWISARWSQLPGQNPLNQQLLNWVHSETSGFTQRFGGPAFAPRASPAGSGGASRGCATGSTVAPVASVLADPALAPIVPPGEPALALNCDVVFASGGLFGLRTRSTSVDAAGVPTDSTSVGYSRDGAEFTPAAGFVDPAKLGELGELLLASLGYRDLPTMFVPAAIARPITAAEGEALGSPRFIADSVPAPDGSLVFTIRLDDLPGGGPTLLQRAEWASVGAIAGDRVAVRLDSPGPWLSESGVAAVATAAAAAPPAWQAVPAGRQTIDCVLVPCVAVTFDDGPGADSERLLQILAETNSAASFFLMGSAVNRAPGIAAPDTPSRTTPGVIPTSQRCR